MLYKHFTEKLLGLQGVEIEKIKEIDNSIHIYCKLELKPHRCPACSAMIIALISTLVVTQLFETNAISFAVCIFFITILLAWILTLIKIKILENERGDK